MKKIDLTGQRFGRWFVIEEAGRTKDKKALWKCQCDCGNTSIVKSTNLRSGHSQSCGCLRKENGIKANTKHGMSDSPELHVWHKMIKRCTNPNNPAYKNYGGRGITICDRWRNSFEAFYKDIGPRPHKNLTIERTDNNKGYCPENCRWATRKENNRNVRKRRDNTSGIVGVYWHKGVGKWCATIGGKHVGYFSSIEEAAEARQKAKIQYWDKPECVAMADHMISLSGAGIEID